VKILQKYAANNIAGNFSAKIRNKRMAFFIEFLDSIKTDKTLKILDIGGTNYFWDLWLKNIPFTIDLTLLNINNEITKGYKSIILDANELYKLDKLDYDVVFSNSLIEHLTTYENQIKFAETILRISKKHFIQTPAFIFPLEPHFLFPFFHWFSKNIRVFLVQHFNLGWYKKQDNLGEAKKLVDEIRILKKKELKDLFPNSKIVTEKMFFITKSYIIVN
jgi:hypothetical protein